MHHIFVSYSRSDGAWVRGLAERLKRQRHDVWIDQQDIPVTVPWMAEVRDAIEEAILFLRCDSPEFRRSASCSAEVGLAVQAARPQFVVTVGEDLDGCAARVRQTLQEISSARLQRTELRVLARDWDRAGRPRNRLVSPLHRRRLAATTAIPPKVSEVEQSFLRASRARSLRRVLVGTVTSVLISTSLATTGAMRAANNRINTDNSQVAAGFTAEQRSLDQISRDPYVGLAAAAGAGGSETIDHAEVISAALADPTPDDAFSVPDARSFVVRPVGAEVIVADAHGHDWSRPAAATGARRASELTGVAPPSSAPGDLTARASPRSGLVQVRRNGSLWRTVAFDGATRVLAFSPDDRFLAVAVGEQVDVADLNTGQVRITMRGATGNLLDIAWGADGRHVWALSASTVFSWLTGNAYTLADNLAADYNSVLPATRPDAVWTVGRHWLTEISVTTGKTLARTKIDDTIQSARGAPGGSSALVSGKRYLWIVPLTSHVRPRRVLIKNCSLGRPTFGDEDTAYLPCIGGPLLKLSMPSATVISRLQVSSAGVFGAAAVPDSHVVYVGDQAGYLYVVEDSRIVRILASQCGADQSRIAIAPANQAILSVGSGSGMSLAKVAETRLQLAERLGLANPKT